LTTFILLYQSYKTYSTGEVKCFTLQPGMPGLAYLWRSKEDVD
jgi:hypothetical protein